VQTQLPLPTKPPHHQWEDKTYFITFSTYKPAFLTAGCRDLILKTCLTGNGRLFELHAVVVMHDQVHFMLTPLADDHGTISIPEITRALKSMSAHSINKYLGRKEKVWQDESFDRAMREVDSVRGKMEYMLGQSSAREISSKSVRVQMA